MNSLWRIIAVAASVAALCTSGFGQSADVTGRDFSPGSEPVFSN
jgi:hypothetical protein